MPDESPPASSGTRGPDSGVDLNESVGGLSYSGAKGQSSRREFDADAAGGPVEDLDYNNYDISPGGVDDVTTHVGRFEGTRANEIMVDRLERIAAGTLEATAADLRFYSHELRELQRYRNLGVPDGVDPSWDVWNNTHTATLEDFRLKEVYRDELLTCFDTNRVYMQKMAWLLVS